MEMSVIEYNACHSPAALCMSQTPEALPLEMNRGATLEVLFNQT